MSPSKKYHHSRFGIRTLRSEKSGKIISFIRSSLWPADPWPQIRTPPIIHSYWSIRNLIRIFCGTDFEYWSLLKMNFSTNLGCLESFFVENHHFDYNLSQLNDFEILFQKCGFFTENSISNQNFHLKLDIFVLKLVIFKKYREVPSYFSQYVSFMVI